MRADAALTRQLLGWAPRSRLGIIRRLPFLVENLRTDPLEWNRRNEQAMKTVQVSDYVQIHWLLQKHESEIIGRFNDELRSPARGERFARYQALSDAEHDWNHRLLLRQLMNAVRTGDKTVFTAYCHDLAQRASREGFTAAEFCGALEQLNLIVLRVLRRDPDAARMRQPLLDYVTMTLRFGCDQAQDTFELAGAHHEAPIGA
jgi:hypothetical protein